MKRHVYLLILLAFLLRIGLGISAAQLLPAIGYESKSQQAGYLFFDAYRRDSQAWELAESEKPLTRAFDGKYSSDQYGGLLWISAFLYRLLSAGTHQPMIVVTLAALVGACGVWFVFMAARRVAAQIGMDAAASERSALVAALIFAFFPEAILLGASQMREPFLMTFVAVAFYGITEWQETHRKQNWAWIFLALAGMLLISPGIVVITLLGLTGWLYFSTSNSRVRVPWQVLVATLIALILAVAVLTASWDSLVQVKGSGFLGIIGSWARGTTRWNAYLLERSSGIVQVLFKSLPPVLAFPFVAMYGILQPVLPAVLMEPGIVFWQILGILRALGWFLALPLVAFAPIANGIMLFDDKTAKPERKQTSATGGLLWLSLVVWGWIVVAALRGGGDQWDNPRYRVILLAWIAIIISIAFGQIRSRAQRWFWRICCVNLIILLVFGHWYAWRYIGIGFNLGIRNTLVIAIALSTLVVLGDWLWCKVNKRRE